MKQYFEERIMELESQIKVFGATEERLIKLEIFKEKLQQEIELENNKEG